MKKAISMMLATAMAATCLAGCGSAASSSAAASSEAASSEATSAATSEASTGEKTFENNELNIAVFEGGYGSEYWDEIIKRFEAAYPGVTVNMQISPKIGDIIRPQIVAGNVPDFISMNDNDSTGLISSMVKEHALMDLSDVFEEGGIDDDTPLKDQVIDGLLDSAKCSPYGDGKIYIAPFDASPMGLVYNKTLFEENGWETPVTWDDFFELGDKAKEKGIALFTYQGIYPGYLESMLWPALASATGIDNMKAVASYTPGSLSSDEALKVFQNMAKIGTDGYLMDGTVALNHTQSQTDMMMNKALFIPNGNWMEGEMADAPRADGFEFGLTCAPVLDDGETRYVMSSVEQFEIPANAKNPELAKEFLRFLYTEDSVKLFAEKANGIYALKKANEMVKGIVTDGVYNMNDIYQEGTFMVFGWDAMPDTSKVVIADSVFNVASDVKHECLDELFNTILAVTVRKVDCVKERDNQLKRTDTGNVQRIFDDGNITQNVWLCLDDMRFYNLKILMVRVATIVNYAVVIHHILDTQKRLVSKTVVVHYKSVSWVKRVDFKRGVIVLTYVLIWKNHSERRTADMEPVSKFLILCRLLFGKHKFVKLIDCV